MAISTTRKALSLLAAISLAPLLASAADLPATLPTAIPSTQAATAATAPSPLYRQIVDDYLAADWQSLPTELTQKAKDIKALSKFEQADLAYIQKTLAECRPAWWDQVKPGKKVAFHPMLWNRAIAVVYDPSIPASVQVQSINNQPLLFVKWQTSDMDSTLQAEHGFTHGDIADLGVWSTLELANGWTSLNFDKVSKLSSTQRADFQRYMEFRGCLAGAYYGTPHARRWSIFLSLDAFFGNHVNDAEFMPRRPLGAMIMDELAAHPAQYPNLHLPSSLPADRAEATLAPLLMRQFERTTLTLDEDKALREAIKTFASANGPAVFDTGDVTLPNKDKIALYPPTDGDFAVKRNTWLHDEINR